MKLPIPIAFEWDKGNIDKNWNKHKLFYKEAEEVFFNRPIKLFSDFKHSKKETRYLALGKTNEERYVTIVFTIINSKIRVISARNQNRKERKIYEQ